MRHVRLTLLVLAALSMLGWGCQGFSTGSASAPEAESIDEEQPPSEATPQVEDLATVEETLAPVGPTLTPTVTPTRGPTPTPSPTPVPTLSPTARRSLSELESKLQEFRLAVRGGDNATTLRMQRELLEALGRAETPLRSDRSEEGERAREAIADVRAGLQGDLAKLDAGAAEIRRLVAAAPAGTPLAGGTPTGDASAAADPEDLVKELADGLAAFRTAAERNDTAGMLKQQARIVELSGRLDQQFRNAHSPSADQLRSALADVGNGLGGDLDKLAGAEEKLRAWAGDEPSASAPRAASPTAQRVDVQPLANDLNNNLGALANAYQNEDPEAVKRAQENLRKAVDKAAEAIKDDRSPRAARLREALGVVREAAGGDESKVEAAREALRRAQ